jgi:uncharacterized protein YndB with AHSA1/START domain
MQNPIIITRVFNAPREQVWKAWTEAEEIKKWWGPKDFTAPDIRIDFREGGKYVYCMRGSASPGTPAQDLYSAGVFEEIVPLEKIVVTDSFADKDGNHISPSSYGMEGMPEKMHLTVTFEDEAEGKTKLTLTYTDQIPEDHKQNMLAGWNQSLDKLAESLV